MPFLMRAILAYLKSRAIIEGGFNTERADYLSSARVEGSFNTARAVIEGCLLIEGGLLIEDGLLSDADF